MDKPTTSPAAPGSKAEEARPPEPLVRDSHTTGSHHPSARVRQFEIVFDQVADGITVYDSEGNLVYANEAAVRLFGYPSLAALLASSAQDIRRPFEIMDESGQPFPIDQLPNQRVLRGEQEVEAVVRYRVVATGEEHWSNVTARRVFDTEERCPFIVSIVRDITERKRSEAALRFLAGAGMVLAPSLDYAATLQDLARLIVPFLADACIIDVREGGVARRMATVHVDPAQQKLMDELSIYPPDRISAHPVFNALQYGQSALGPELPDSLLVSIAQDAHHLQILRELHPRSYMVVPMQARGRILGAITFWIIDSKRRYSQTDLNLAEDLARHAALAVDNARLFQAEQLARAAADKARFRTTQLQAVTAGLAEALTSREVADVMTNEGTKVLGAEAAWVALISTKGRTLEIMKAAYVTGGDLDFADHIPIDAPLPLAEAARSGKPILLRSPEDFRRYPLLDTLLHGDHDRVFAAIPLVAEKRILGVLGLRFPASSDFTEDEIGLMNTLAQECAQALERARLYAAERAARMASEANGQRLAFLAEASRILATSLNYEQTLTRLAQIAVPQLADWCTVDILEEDGSVGHLAVAHVDEEKVRWARELYERYPYDPNGTEGLPRVFRTGEPELYPDIPEAMLEASTNDPELREILRAVGFTSVMIVPLVARGRTLGAITFVSAESQRHYGTADLEFVQDLASRAAIALDNARLYRDAQRAIKAREEFISIASHELKTPLTTVKTYSQLLSVRLRKPDADPSRLHYLTDRLESQVRRLEILVADLLDASRIQQGRLEIIPEALDLAELSREVLNRFDDSPLRQSGHRLILDAPEPVLGCWDAGRLDQVLTNLVSNALKYSPQGGEILLRLRHDDESAELSVSDQGIGISPEERARLFQPFMRAAGSGDVASGQGLGLFITARIVKAHAGTIAVDSQQGRGTTFTIRLPRSR